MDQNDGRDEAGTAEPQHERVTGAGRRLMGQARETFRSRRPDAAGGRPPAGLPPVAEPFHRPHPAVAEEDLAKVIADCAVYDSAGRTPGRVSLAGAVIAAQRPDGFVWIGLRQPSADEFATVASEFRLPALAVEDAVVAHQRPKLEIYGDVLFAVLKPVRYVDSEEVVAVSEIAIFLGESFVITVRHGDSDVLHQVRSELDRAESPLLQHGPTSILYRAADLVVDQYERVGECIALDVDEIEGLVFGGGREDHAQRIYKLKREVMQFRRAVVPLAHPLQLLAGGEVPFVDPAAAPYFRDVHDHVLRATDAIEAHDRLLSDVLSVDLAQVSVRQNETSVRQNEDMRKISAWAAIALVPTAVAGIYGMNFHYIPELSWHYGYFAALAFIASICGALYLAFRRNGWL